MKILRTTDRISLYLGDDVSVECSPLSYQQKSEVMAKMLEGQKAQDIKMLNEASHLAVRMSLKAIKGLTDFADQPYQLSFSEGLVTEECLNDILNVQGTAKMMQVLTEFVNGVPDASKLPEGVSYSPPATSKKKKS